MNIVRLSEDNQNLYEAIKGQWAQEGTSQATFTIMKNLLFINLYSGASFSNYTLPATVHDGFIQLSDGNVVTITNSKLTCSLDKGVTGFGILVLNKWN